MINDILLEVNKPGRYVGGEWNLPKKDFNNCRVRFALVFPDLYEVGMSNLGIRIIYGILNSLPDVSCERFFSYGLDMENILRDRKLGPLSLETGRPLKEFDVIGFSLGSELSYANVLNILDLARIPLKASLRGHTHPLIIAGGPCALNPEPMHEFFDLFVIGEAEELILEFVELYQQCQKKFRTSRVSKEELLFMFSQIEGIYVPSLYEVEYDNKGRPQRFQPKVGGLASKVKKRIVKDLNNSFFPLDWLVPYIQIVHDRISLEIMRGCANRCRFCQARSGYFPLRFREVNNILALAYNAYKRTGYEEISLCGLSVSDYPHVRELLEKLIELFKNRAVGVSLPSIKPKTIVGNLASLVATIKKTGLTFAPEAGSERLREVLAKDFNEEEAFGAIEQAFRAGYRRVKLYFMIGLPGEEKEDLDAIIDLARRISELRKKVNYHISDMAISRAKRRNAKKPASAEVNISINTLIPKPHTAFQWLKMAESEAIRYKQDYLKSKIKNEKLTLNFHNLQMSFLEGALSRGDRRLSAVIFSAFKKGARFDAWNDFFVFDRWSSAFKESNIDPHFYLEARGEDELLPWDFVDVGIDKDSLLLEFKGIRQKLDSACINRAEST